MPARRQHNVDMHEMREKWLWNLVTAVYLSMVSASSHNSQSFRALSNGKLHPNNVGQWRIC